MRNLMIFMILLLLIFSSGCNQTISTNDDLISTDKEMGITPPQPDQEGLIYVFYPLNLLRGYSPEEFVETYNEAEMSGFITNIIPAIDGVTMIFSEEQYVDYKTRIYNNAKLEGFIGVTSVQKTEFLDKYLREINIYVDKERYQSSSLDRFQVILGGMVYGGDYQILCGFEPDKWGVKANMIDYATNEVIESLNLPEDITIYE